MSNTMRNLLMIAGYLTFVSVGAVIVTCALLCVTDASAKSNKVADRITYYKDDRTNLCFASFDNRLEAFTNVPCTTEVEKFVKLTVDK